MVQNHVPAGAIPQPVVELCRSLEGAGARAWVVGGSLRDVLMERAPKDWDLATSATPEQVMRIFPRTVPTGIEHGTVTVLLGSESYEITTLRGEGGYSDSRRPDSVRFIGDIEQDLARRDFTVNALAYDPLRDQLVDPFGGLGDMRAGILRTVGRAEERFAEDGLRVLRAARFVATLELAIDPSTRAAIGSALSAFERVSHERVRQEWMRCFEARSPSQAFQLMLETGILGVTCPELVEQAGCEQNRHHAYDVWTHSMKCMDACDGGPVHRLAGLLHDLGKPRTRARSDKTGDYTFYDHELVGARMADAWLQRYRFSAEEREKVVHLVRHHLVCYSPTWSDAAVRRFARRVGLSQVDDLLRLAHADLLAKGRDAAEDIAGLAELRGRIEAAQAAGAAFGLRDLAIDGRDVMQRLGAPPGPIVGKVLERLLERVLDHPEENERERLLQLVDAIKGEVA